jgi:hypothetical protein
VPVSDEDDFHATSNKKKAQVLEVCQHLPEHAQTMALSLVATFPLDHLSYRLQMLDFAGGSMLELTSARRHGSLPKFLQVCWELVNTWSASPHAAFLPALEWHLEAMGVPPHDFRIAACAKVLAMAAAAFCRLYKFPLPPWSLLSAHLLPPHEEIQMWREFILLTPPCCHDAWWGQPFHAMLVRMAAGGDMKNAVDEIKPAIIHLARKLRATNMALEGELSEVRRSVPSFSGGPTAAEKLSYVAHAQAVLSKFAYAIRIVTTARISALFHSFVAACRSVILLRHL